MDKTGDNEQLRISELIRLAEIEFPYPIPNCVFIRAKVDWQREKWIDKQKGA